MFLFLLYNRYALKVGALFVPVLVVTLAFAVLAVNEEHMVFHFLYAILCCCQSLFIFIFYVACDPKVRISSTIFIALDLNDVSVIFYCYQP